MNKLFTKYLDIYDQLYYGNQALYRKEVAEIIKYFPSRAKSILDIGCGTGKHALELFKLGYQVDCLDISPLAVKTARKNLRKYKAKITLGNVVNFNPNKKYDAAIALFMVLSYLPAGDFSKALKNIYRNLNKGGVFIFDVVNGQQLANEFEAELKISGKGIKAIWERKMLPEKQILTTMALIAKGNRIYRDKQAFAYYFPKELEKILKKAGFKKIKVFTNYKGAKKYNGKRTKLCVICYK